MVSGEAVGSSYALLMRKELSNALREV